ncbi:MAG: lamin tail domain-containing protein, partial [Gemmatimonadetes bacterium]|nr:lamin tail domain-containing protein [Gemmatimonadota bacterium]
MREFRERMGCVLILGAVFAGGARAAAPGDVVITEIMQNPAAVSDANGEWIELYNSTGSPIDIEGWTIGDGDAENHTIQAGGSSVIPANGFYVMGRFSDVTQNGGVTLDYPYTGMTLGNGADAVVLKEGGATIDSVGYDDGVTFPDPSGASMELVDPAADNSVGGNWEENLTDPYGDGDYGTPGAANHAWGAIGGPPAIDMVAHFPLYPS